jgi:hypothetical protein
MHTQTITPHIFIFAISTERLIGKVYSAWFYAGQNINFSDPKVCYYRLLQFHYNLFDKPCFLNYTTT